MIREFLFATWEGGGNIPPVMTLVRRLVARGHRVRVVGDGCTRAEAEAAGAEFAEWRRAPSRPDHSPASDPMRDWEASDPAEVIRRIIDMYMCGNALAQAQDVLEELARRPADAIVSSEMLLGPMLAGEAADVPVAALGCNIPILPLPGVPPFGPGFLPPRDEAERRIQAEVQGMLDALLQGGLPSLNAARTALGLAPLASVGEIYGRIDRYLCATAAAFDFPSESVPENFRYVGPLLDEPAWAEAPLPSGFGAERPLVLVALSTTYQAQEDLLRRVAAALGTVAVDAVVTTGPAISPESIEAPENVLVLRHASHDAILARAAAVVTHCGHGTVMRALRAGVPLLCLPMGRDQNDNAARVAARGAGLRLDAHASPEDIAEGLTRLIQEPAFTAGARRLGAAVAAQCRPEAAADELERVAERRHPAQSPVPVAALA